MTLEKERKFKIKSQTVFKKLISQSLNKTLIVQWYDNQGLRTRLEKFSDDNEIWTLNYKKEIAKGIREEEEKIIKKDCVNIEVLKNQRMVMKYRYLLNQDPEIVIDELLNPNNCINYRKELKEIKYLLEIEEKSKNINLDSYLKDFLGKLYFDLEDLTYKEGYNNSDFAGEYICEWETFWENLNSKIW
jgi:hypothetical protein